MSATYQINCQTAPPPPPPIINKCAPGLVFGPAKLTAPGDPDNVHGVYEFVQVNPLPITLVKFSASLNADESVNVDWTTVLEVNSAYVSVERSADAVGWEPIGQVATKGNSVGDVNYTYKDVKPLNPISYYRLKMVDLDGKFKYSKVASVSLNGKSAAFVVFSNPFHDMIRIKVNLPAADKLDLKLTDMLGRTYSAQSYMGQPGDNFINITPFTAPSGLYILNVNGKSINQTVKLVKE